VASNKGDKISREIQLGHVKNLCFENSTYIAGPLS
jgi:hypothetical protein